MTARWLRARLAAQPVATDKAITATLGMAFALRWIRLDEVQLGAVIATYAAWSAVLVWNAVTPNAKAGEQAARARHDGASQRELEIHAYLASVEAPQQNGPAQPPAAGGEARPGRPLRARPPRSKP